MAARSASLASANGGAGNLECASCSQIGSPGETDADFYSLNTTGGGSRFTPHLNHVLSDDGRYVFFNSGDRLTPDDQNDRVDAYEYDTTTAEIHLLSSGRGTSDAVFLEATPDGHDVIIASREQLTPSDKDTSVDLYDARVGGVAEQPSSPSVPCAGDGCRPPASTAGVPGGPPSMTADGPGNTVASHDSQSFFHMSALTARQKKVLQRRGIVRVTIMAAKTGTIDVRLNARLDGHRRMVDRQILKIDGGTALHVKLRLKLTAQRHLTTTGRLSLVITASYSKSSTLQSQRITLRSTDA